MRLVIAYYVIDDNYEFSYAQLVNLDNDELVQIKREDDFYRYKDFIYLYDRGFRINTFVEFLNFIVNNCDSADVLKETDVSRLVLAIYTNGYKVLEIESGKVYSYHKNSMFLHHVYCPEYGLKGFGKLDAARNKVLGCSGLLKHNPRFSCNVKGELDVIRSELDTHWLELYNCGSGVLILDKFRSMEGADLVIFPSELKYLVGVRAEDFSPKVVHCDTVMFTTSTKYVTGYEFIKFIKFKKLLLSRECKGVSDCAPKRVEYID